MQSRHQDPVGADARWAQHLPVLRALRHSASTPRRSRGRSLAFQSASSSAMIASSCARRASNSGPCEPRADAGHWAGVEIGGREREANGRDGHAVRREYKRPRAHPVNTLMMRGANAADCAAAAAAAEQRLAARIALRFSLRGDPIVALVLLSLPLLLLISAQLALFRTSPLRSRELAADKRLARGALRARAAGAQDNTQA